VDVNGWFIPFKRSWVVFVLQIHSVMRCFENTLFLKMSRRREVLSLYRKILREGKRWELESERPGILDEARLLFRKNRSIEESLIESRLFEGVSRMELALHYKNASPRLFYSQKGTDPDCDSVQKNFKKNHPAYMASYDLD
jgi:hypothetical protein